MIFIETLQGMRVGANKIRSGTGTLPTQAEGPDGVVSGLAMTQVG
jgi:hypothetical protein